MEDSDGRKRKKPESLLEDDLTRRNLPKVAKSQDEFGVTKIHRRDPDGGGAKPEFDSKGEENGSLGEEGKQGEQLGSHSGHESDRAKKNDALDPEGTSLAANGNEQEIVKDKGKGKIVVESETEDDDDEESGGVGILDEDTDSDLSDDPLMEVDPANILPSWTRRRTAHSGRYSVPVAAGIEDTDDDDDDDVSDGEEVDDDNDDDDDDEDVDDD
ncbi:unnamed protein product [Victoria cruziana]